MNPITKGAPTKSPPRYALVHRIEIAAKTQPIRAATTTASNALANELFGINDSALNLPVVDLPCCLVQHRTRRQQHQ